MPRRVTPDLVSMLLTIAGMVAVVVAVAGSPAPWWAAVLAVGAETWAAAWAVARNAQDKAGGERDTGPDLRSVA